MHSLTYRLTNASLVKKTMPDYIKSIMEEEQKHACSHFAEYGYQ